MKEERLQKFLAEAGVASRRKAEELIRQGRVSVNGKILTEMGNTVSENDIVEVDNRAVHREEKKVYIMLNKPSGYVTTVTDQFARKTVLDLVKGINERIYPVGRLDYDTSGLLLLTNDGELTHKLTHPGHEIKKVYKAEIKGMPDGNEIKSFQEGLSIEDYVTSPAEFSVVKQGKTSSEVEITIHEGRNRQVRKMCEAIGHPVIRLQRIRVGNLELGSLATGEWRHLTPEEIKGLKT